MENISVNKSHKQRAAVKKYFQKMYRRPMYRFLLILTGILAFLVAAVKHFMSRDKKTDVIKVQLDKRFKEENIKEQIYQDVLRSERNKVDFLNLKISEMELLSRVKKIAEGKYKQAWEEELAKLMKEGSIKPVSIKNTFLSMIDNDSFFGISIILAPLMYILIIVYSKPYLKYISERIIMMVFVMLGVVVLVFTILYISPMDPARNILGQEATPEKVAEFQHIYGLDKPYLEQLFYTFKKCITFDWGNAYVGNENIMDAIARRFPITVQLAFASLLVSVGIAIPSGIISAIKQYSSFDYFFMFIALLGLSIPNFWLGLILILNFSIKLGWLPAMYDVSNWMTLIMPAIVLGTGLSASVARMTRSSMLEVKSQDYILTARAKGLSERRVILKHILGNAMIPIVTVIGLQFGGLLGGSTVTEKVFNVNGLGKYIVEKQFIPDIPVVLAGVVYIAIIISLVNLAVDILYAFLDPRIKSQIKNY